MVRVVGAAVLLFLSLLVGACAGRDQLALDRIKSCIQVKCPVIVLNSPGGDDIRYWEQAAVLVKASGIPVHVEHDCSSACTLPLFAARSATVASGATVRIHPVTLHRDEQVRTMRGPGAPVRTAELDKETTEVWAQIYLAGGVPLKTVSRLRKGEAVTLQPSDFAAMKNIRIVDSKIATR